MATLKEILVKYLGHKATATSTPIVTSTPQTTVIASEPSQVETKASIADVAIKISADISEKINKKPKLFMRLADNVVPYDEVVSFDLILAVTFTKVLDETLSLDDFKRFDVNKGAVEALSLSDVLDRIVSYQRDIVDTPAIQDLMSKSFSKSSSDDSVSGSDSISLRPNKVVSDSFSQTDAAYFGVNKGKVEFVNVSDVLTRSVSFNRTITDIISIYDIAQFPYGNNEQATDMSMLTDTARLSVNKVLNETGVTTDAMSKVISKRLSDSVIITETLSYVFGYGRALTDTLASTDSLTYRMGFGRSFTENTVISDNLAKLFGKVLSENGIVSDSVVKSVTKVFQDNSIINEALVYSLNISKSDTSDVSETLSINFSKILSDTLSVTDSLDYNFLGQDEYNTSDTGALSDTLSLAIGKTLQDLSNVSESLSLNYSKILSDEPLITESFSVLIQKPLSESVGVTDLFDRLVNFNRTFDDTLVTSDLSSMDVDKSLSETNSISELFTINFNKLLNDILFMQDLLSYTMWFGRAFEDSTSNTDQQQFNVSKVLSDILNITDSLSSSAAGNYEQSSSDTGSVSDSLLVVFSKYLEETINQLDSISLSISKIFEDSVANTDSQNWSFGKVTNESLTIDESNSKDIDKVSIDNIIVSESLPKILDKKITTSSFSNAQFMAVTTSGGNGIALASKPYHSWGWFKIHAYPSTSLKFIMGLPTTSTNYGYGFHIHRPSNTLVVYDNLYNSYSSSTSIKVNKWYFFEQSYNNSTRVNELSIRGLDPNDDIFWALSGTNKLTITNTSTPPGNDVFSFWGDSVGGSGIAVSAANWRIYGNSIKTFGTGYSNRFSSSLDTEGLAFAFLGDILCPIYNDYPFPWVNVYHDSEMAINDSPQENILLTDYKLLSIEPNKEDTTTVTESYNFNIVPSYIETVTSDDTASKSIAPSYSETVTFEEFLSKALSVQLSDTLTITDIFNTDWSDEGNDYNEYPSESASFSEILAMVLSKIDSDSVAVTESQIKDFDKTMVSPFVGSVVVNSSTDYIERTTNLPSMHNFTMAGWFKRSVDEDNFETALILEVNDGSPWHNLLYASLPSWETTPNAAAVYNSGGGGMAPWTTPLPALNTWYYFAITGNATNLTGYWFLSDGTFVSSVATTAMGFKTSSAMRAGSHTTDSRYINGKIAQVRVWDAVLNQSELSAELASSMPVRLTNLNTAWNSDPTLDVSGNDRPWSVSGVTYDSDGPPNYAYDTVTTVDSLTKDFDKDLMEDASISELNIKDFDKEMVFSGTAYIHSVNIASQGAGSPTLTIPLINEPVSGGLIVVLASSWTGGGTGSWFCNTSGGSGIVVTERANTPGTSGGINGVLIWTIEYSSAPTSITIGRSPDATNITFAAVAVNVANQAASYLDVVGTELAYTTSISVASMGDLTDDSDLVLGVVALEGSNRIITPGTNWTQIAEFSEQTSMIYRIPGATGSYDPAWTLNGLSNSYAAGIAIKGVSTNIMRDTARVSQIPSKDFDKVVSYAVANPVGSSYVTYGDAENFNVQTLTTPSISVRKGDVIFAAIKWEDANNTPSIADTAAGGSNTYTYHDYAHYSTLNGGVYATNVKFYSAIAKATESITVTATYESPYPLYQNFVVIIGRPSKGKKLEFDVSKVAGAPDGGSVTADTGSATLSGLGGIAFGYTCTYGAGISTLDADWTTIYYSGNTFAYKVLTNETSLSYTTVYSSATEWSTGFLAFKEVDAQGSVVVDATTDYVRRSANLPSTTNVTMAGWVKVLSWANAGTGMGTICCLENVGSTSYNGVWLDIAGSNQGQIIVANNITGNQACTALVLSNWYYIAYTSNGTNQFTYIYDSAGNPLDWSNTTNTYGTSTDAASTYTPAYLSVGNDDYSMKEYLNARFSQWRVWDAVLTQAEIEAEMASPIPVKTTSLNTAWGHDPLIDQGANNRPWTVNGIAYDTDYPPNYSTGSTYDTAVITESATKAISKSSTSEQITVTEIPNKIFNKYVLGSTGLSTQST